MSVVEVVGVFFLVQVIYVVEGGVSLMGPPRA